MKSRPENASINVLIVDDQPVARKAVKRVLESLGCEAIFEASNIWEASEIAEKELIEFVVVDMNLSEEKGTSLIEFVRQKDFANDVPVLVVTGEAEREEIIRAVDFGASDYLLKPFHADDLETKFNQLLEGYMKPDETSRLLRNAERLMVALRPTEALMYIDQAHEIDRKSLRALHLKALALFRLGQFDEAIALLSDIVAVNPKHFRSHRLLADIKMKLGHIPQAIQHLEKELELNPRSPARQNLMGKILIGQSRMEQAATHLREALKLENKHPEALFGMAQVNASQENLDKALYYIKRIRRHHPKHRAALDLAVALAMKHDIKRQVELLLRDERAQHPERLDVHHFLGNFYISIGEEDKADEVAARISTQFPNEVEALISLGDMAVRTKKFEVAIRHYRSAAVHSKSREAYKKLTKVLIQAKKWQEAEQAAAALFSLKATSDAIRLLAEIQFKTKNFTKAHILYSLFEKACPGEKAPPAAQSAAEMIGERRKRKLGFAS